MSDETIDRDRLEKAIAMYGKAGEWAGEPGIVLAAARAHLATLPAPPERKASLRQLLGEIHDRPLWRSAAYARLDELEAKVPKEEKKRATVGELAEVVAAAANVLRGSQTDFLREAVAVLRAVEEFREKWGEPKIVRSVRRELSMLEQDALALLKKLP